MRIAPEAAAIRTAQMQRVIPQAKVWRMRSVMAQTPLPPYKTLD